MTRFRSALILAAAFVVLFTAPASAHSSHVTHQETCADDGQTTTVVTFDNDYAAPADVSYQWGSEAPGTAHLEAKTGSANTTVSLPSHAVGTLAWHVTWADNYRQPGEGESTLTVEPLTDCHATTTTTGSATTTTTKPAATTTSTAPATTTTTAAAVAAPASTTLPTAVLGTNETKTLPRTGVPILFLSVVAGFALATGWAFRYVGRQENRHQ